MFKAGQAEYKKRPDMVATRAHRELGSKYGVEPGKHWYEHRVEEVMENQDTKILWDLNIRTNCVIKAKCPDIVLIDKNRIMFIIDVAIPGDFYVRDNKAKKNIEIPRFCIGNISNVEHKN